MKTENGFGRSSFWPRCGEKCNLWCREILKKRTGLTKEHDVVAYNLGRWKGKKEEQEREGIVENLRYKY